MVGTLVRCPGTQRRGVPGDQTVPVGGALPPIEGGGPRPGRGAPGGAAGAVVSVPDPAPSGLDATNALVRGG